MAENFGMAAPRWTPIAFSPSTRTGLAAITALATGATGLAISPIRDGRLMIWSRRLRPPRAATRRPGAIWLISATITPSGQAWVQSPQAEQKSRDLSGESPVSMPARNRWPCGPSYLGPGNRSVTAETGQTVLHTLHLMQWSAVCSTCSTAASGSAGRGGGEQDGDPGGGGQGDPLAGALDGRVVAGEQAADAADVGQQ